MLHIGPKSRLTGQIIIAGPPKVSDFPSFYFLESLRILITTLVDSVSVRIIQDSRTVTVDLVAEKLMLEEKSEKTMNHRLA